MVEPNTYLELINDVMAKLPETFQFIRGPKRLSPILQPVDVRSNVLRLDMDRKHFENGAATPGENTLPEMVSASTGDV